MRGHLDGKGGSAWRETRWLTPPSLVQKLGTFDLDPAGAPGHELARRTYLLENGDDGLRDPWEGRIWLNPPYGREQVPFVRRLAEHDHGTALLFAGTETALWHEEIWPKAAAILFLRGRVRFLRADGTDASATSGKGSVLIAYGDEDAGALAFSGLAGHLVML